MWLLAMPVMSEEEIAFNGSYRDADEWEILNALLAATCAIKQIEMPYAVQFYMNRDLLPEYLEEIKKFAVLDKPKHTTMTQEEFDELLKTLPKEPWE